MFNFIATLNLYKHALIGGKFPFELGSENHDIKVLT